MIGIRGKAFEIDRHFIADLHVLGRNGPMTRLKLGSKKRTVTVLVVANFVTGDDNAVQRTSKRFAAVTADETESIASWNTESEDGLVRITWAPRTDFDLRPDFARHLRYRFHDASL